jgi:hypothetical protein
MTKPATRRRGKAKNKDLWWAITARTNGGIIYDSGSKRGEIYATKKEAKRNRNRYCNPHRLAVVRISIPAPRKGKA